MSNDIIAIKNEKEGKKPKKNLKVILSKSETQAHRRKYIYQMGSMLYEYWMFYGGECSILYTKSQLSWHNVSNQFTNEFQTMKYIGLATPWEYECKCICILYIYIYIYLHILLIFLMRITNNVPLFPNFYQLKPNSVVMQSKCVSRKNVAHD